MDAIKDHQVHAIEPERDDTFVGQETVNKAISYTRDVVDSIDRPASLVAVKNGSSKDARHPMHEVCDPKLAHCGLCEHGLPFSIVCAYDETRGISHPDSRTVKRDFEMWEALPG